MIKQVFNVEYYWKVIVYYNVNYNLFNIIANTLKDIQCPNYIINEIYYYMKTHKAKAVTISNCKYKVSVLLFNKHSDYYDYINSAIHEAEHIKQALLKCYRIDDEGEAPAYTIGFLASKMIKKMMNINL